MILSITDGIEVAEHTELQERIGFLHLYRLAQESRPSECARIDETLGHASSPFMSRQAE